MEVNFWWGSKQTSTNNWCLLRCTGGNARYSSNIIIHLSSQYCRHSSWYTVLSSHTMSAAAIKHDNNRKVSPYNSPSTKLLLQNDSSASRPSGSRHLQMLSAWLATGNHQHLSAKSLATAFGWMEAGRNSRGENQSAAAIKYKVQNWGPIAKFPWTQNQRHFRLLTNIKYSFIYFLPWD